MHIFSVCPKNFIQWTLKAFIIWGWKWGFSCECTFVMRSCIWKHKTSSSKLDVICYASKYCHCVIDSMVFRRETKMFSGFWMIRWMWTRSFCYAYFDMPSCPEMRAAILIKNSPSSTNIHSSNNKHKLFSFSFRLQTSKSNRSYITLKSVEPSISGKYVCEISADAPSFHTVIQGKDMEVVDVPLSKPVITEMKSQYRIGDFVKGNCTGQYSRPASNLTWLMNDKQVRQQFVLSILVS